MSKPPQKGDYSREREFKVILEDIQSQFRVFGEGLGEVRERVIRMEERMEHLEEKVEQVAIDVSGMKSFLRPFSEEVSDHSRRLTILEKSR